MSSTIERKAADVSPGTPYSIPTVSTEDGQRIAIPEDMRGKFCAFAARTLDVAIRFGGADVEVDPAAASTVSEGAITVAGAKIPHLRLVAGAAPEHFRLRHEWTHFAHISSGTTGALDLGSWQGQEPRS